MFLFLICFFITIVFYLYFYFLVTLAYNVLIKRDLNICVESSFFSFIYCFIFCLFVLYRFFHFTEFTVCFDSIIVDSFSIELIIINICLFCFILYFCNAFLYFTDSTDFFLYFSSILLLLFNILLWCICDFLSLILILDCINLLILFYFYNFQNLDTNSFDVYQDFIFDIITSVSIFFWISFLGTIFFFFFLIYLLLFFFTVDFMIIILLIETLFNNISFIEHLQFFIFILFFIFFFFLKAGIVPFFMWKNSILHVLDFSIICIYLIYYYSNILFYFIFLFIDFFIIFSIYCYVIIYIILIFSLIFLVIHYEDSEDIYSFLIYSSIINSLLVICPILCIL